MLVDGPRDKLVHHGLGNVGLESDAGTISSLVWDGLLVDTRISSQSSVMAPRDHL